jgi:hypothetical protein
MIKRASLYIEFEFECYDTCLNLGHLFLYLGTIYKKFVLSLLPKINYQNLALL